MGKGTQGVGTREGRRNNGETWGEGAWERWGRDDGRGGTWERGERRRERTDLGRGGARA